MAVGRILEVVIDCADPRELAGFWRQVVGGEIDEEAVEADWLMLVEVPVLGVLGFQMVPEAKSAKNRVHIDVGVRDLAGATAEALALGAVAQGPPVTEDHGSFQVLLDPEGNEFCLVRLDH